MKIKILFLILMHYKMFLVKQVIVYYFIMLISNQDENTRITYHFDVIGR